MTNELLEEIKKRLRAYDEAKNVYEKDDARVAIEGQAHGDIEELVAEVERLREVVRRVHRLAEKALGEYWTVGVAEQTFREIHELTKGEE